MSDFRREYTMGSAELAALSLDEFRILLRGLSEHSRFTKAWANEPKRLYDPADIAAIKAAARR